MDSSGPDFVPASFSDAERAAICKVMRDRRDVRRFRPVPVPPEVLRRVLEMAHLAPSVGFMQPWNFIVVSAPELRRQVKAVFEEVNAREAARIEDPGRKELYARLTLEGILEAPLNLAVTCDTRRDAPFVLGRAPMPQTDVFSTCLAIQNLWLAARAEGVGVGWVSILDRAAIERLLQLPPGVQLVAYLCVGYPIEFRPRPMLEEVGWKGRQPLADLVFEDRWGVPSSLFR
ncbi:MAG TPA: 5,6-dimethylbenzimidazole synthase [Gemmataceae bacterium]|nr:5,6-dimethylbenzimidazole synthase [Gemmataceae bacterium]